MYDGWYVDYKGYRIQPRVYREEGTHRWAAGKYSITWGRGLATVEKLFNDYIEYLDTQAEAWELTLGLAKQTIDAGVLPRRPARPRTPSQNHFQP